MLVTDFRYIYTHCFHSCVVYMQPTAAAGGGSSAEWLVGGGVPLRPNEDPRYFNPDVGGAGVPQGVGVDELRLRMQQQQAAQQRGMYCSSICHYSSYVLVDTCQSMCVTLRVGTALVYQVMQSCLNEFGM
jgi:hypothetical protein